MVGGRRSIMARDLWPVWRMICRSVAPWAAALVTKPALPAFCPRHATSQVRCFRLRSFPSRPAATGVRQPCSLSANCELHDS